MSDLELLRETCAHAGGEARVTRYRNNLSVYRKDGSLAVCVPINGDEDAAATAACVEMVNQLPEPLFMGIWLDGLTKMWEQCRRG